MVIELTELQENQMANHMEGLNPSQRWALLVTAAKEAAQKAGYVLKRVPGRGLSNVWEIAKDGKVERASIRTTRDRWIAYQPLEKGTRWKTLDDVQWVIVAAVDKRDDPENVEVYLFPAADVRKRFKDAYKARIADGQTQQDSFGMWVNLDTDQRGIAASVGSGLVDAFKPIAKFSIKSLLATGTQLQSEEPHVPGDMGDVMPTLNTISEVLAWARQQVAQLAGVEISAVKLDLKLSMES
jgi:hypothetical protein